MTYFKNLMLSRLKVQIKISNNSPRMEYCHQYLKFRAKVSFPRGIIRKMYKRILIHKPISWTKLMNSCWNRSCWVQHQQRKLWTKYLQNINSARTNHRMENKRKSWKKAWEIRRWRSFSMVKIFQTWIYQSRRNLQLNFRIKAKRKRH